MTTPLLVTGDPALTDAVLPAAAAVGVDVTVVPDPPTAGSRWASSPLVLLGPDTDPTSLPHRRPGVLVVTLEDDDRTWRRAVALGAEDVLTLPADQETLLRRLTHLTEPGDHRGPVVGVVGGRGGAGATTLAARLAVTSAAHHRTLLVDADPHGGGVDALLGSETAPGLRWPDLVDLEGPVRGASLRQALPRAHSASVLSWGCGAAEHPPAAAVESVLDAGRHHYGLVVADVPRAGAAPSLLGHLDTLLVVVPAEVRAALAAARVLARVRPHVADVRLVVRGPAPTSLTAEQIADVLDVPLYGWLRAEPRIDATLDSGALPGTRGPLGTWCRAFLRELDPGHGAAAVPVTTLPDPAVLPAPTRHAPPPSAAPAPGVVPAQPWPRPHHRPAGSFA